MKKALRWATLLCILLGMALFFLLPEPAETPKEEPAASKPVAPAPTAPVSDTAWNTFHGDATMRGAADISLPAALEVRWRLKTRAPVRQTPVGSPGAGIFVVTMRGEVIAADWKDGTERWARELFTGETMNNQPVRRRFEAPPAFFDGMFFAGDNDGVFMAFDGQTGADLWQAKLEGPVRGGPNYLGPDDTHPNGRVFVIDSADGAVLCLDAKTGAQQWRAPLGERSDATPAVSPEALVYGSCASALHVVNPADGKRIHDIKLDADSQIAGGCALGDGFAYSGSRSGKIVKADIRAGVFAWTNQDSEAEVFTTPAVAGDTVVAGSEDGFVIAVDRATGKQRWRVDSGGYPLSPVIAGDKVLLAADGELIMLGLADGTKLWSLKVADDITSPMLLGDLVIVGTEDGTVTAFGAAK